MFKYGYKTQTASQLSLGCNLAAPLTWCAEPARPCTCISNVVMFWERFVARGDFLICHGVLCQTWAANSSAILCGLVREYYEVNISSVEIFQLNPKLHPTILVMWNLGWSWKIQSFGSALPACQWWKTFHSSAASDCEVKVTSWHSHLAANACRLYCMTKKSNYKCQQTR